jgi:hypothetical protein
MLYRLHHSFEKILYMNLLEMTYLKYKNQKDLTSYLHYYKIKVLNLDMR